MKLSAQVLVVFLSGASTMGLAAVEQELPKRPGIDTRGFKNELGKWLRVGVSKSGAVY